ncbi:hypothetical protein ACVRZR_00040 [Streptococcus entericus]|nr:hypothetical protein [Streptococcus entericus]
MSLKLKDSDISATTANNLRDVGGGQTAIMQLTKLDRSGHRILMYKGV